MGGYKSAQDDVLGGGKNWYGSVERERLAIGNKHLPASYYRQMNREEANRNRAKAWRQEEEKRERQLEYQEREVDRKINELYRLIGFQESMLYSQTTDMLTEALSKDFSDCGKVELALFDGKMTLPSIRCDDACWDFSAYLYKALKSMETPDNMLWALWVSIKDSRGRYERFYTNNPQSIILVGDVFNRNPWGGKAHISELIQK